jgi:hypothetical protein
LQPRRLPKFDLSSVGSVSAEVCRPGALKVTPGRWYGRNDFAKALTTRAGLLWRAGDIAAARRLLDQAYTIFHTLGTIDESTGVEAALAALDRDDRIP